MNKIRSISELTNADYVATLSTFYSQNRGELNCDSCKKTYRGERGEKIRKRKGCYEVQQFPVFQHPATSPEIKWMQCPGNLYDFGLAYYINLHEKFQIGIMPFEGSIQQQPNKVLELFNMLDRLSMDEQISGQQDKNNSRTRNAGSRTRAKKVRG